MSAGTKKRRKKGGTGAGAAALEHGVVAPNSSLMGAMKQVPMQDLIPYPGNARRGNVDKIVESLGYHGQFKPLIVQKSTGYILAGNHTYKAAGVLGWDRIYVTYLDVDDEQAKKIVLMDNASSDDGTYDYDALLELIVDIPDPFGTGYSDEYVDNIREMLDDIQAGFEDNGGEHPEELTARSSVDDDAPDIDVEDFDSLPGVMKGVTALKADMLFPLIPDDTKIDTWSGPTSSQDDGESFYAYTYGTDSTRGMPWDRTILNFYTSDSRFENWWADPSKYTAKMINAGIAGAVSHDFSMIAGLPRATHLWQTYRARWLSRYMQEAGILIIPSITFADLESFEFCLNGIPIEAPVVSIQMQTLDDEKDRRAAMVRGECIRQAIEMLAPHQLLVYGNTPGFEFIADLDLSCQVIEVDNRAMRRSQWQKERDAGVYKDAKNRKKQSRVTGVSQTGVAMRGH